MRCRHRSTRARRLFFESSSRSSFLFEHDLFGKTLHTFPDHALGCGPAPCRVSLPRSRDWGKRMNVAIVCTALLGLLLFGLGLNVSLQRRQNRRSAGHDASPVDPLHRAIRAHANTAKYAPFFAVMFLWYAMKPAPTGIIATMPLPT